MLSTQKGLKRQHFASDRGHKCGQEYANFVCVRAFSPAIWHIVCVSNHEVLPKKYFRKRVFSPQAGEICVTVSGELGVEISRLFGPTVTETRKSLLELRQKLGCSRAHLAALLGVPIETLRRWEDGTRNPSAPARKLIWMLQALIYAPERLTDFFSIASWGITTQSKARTR